jgi:hypothetical protein
LRKGPALSVGSPAIDASAVASSGPIIQGIGVCSQTHNRAAANASSSVAATRARRGSEGKDGMAIA